jgi:dihydroorotate dehydrogenase electron transfer subunit
MPSHLVSSNVVDACDLPIRDMLCEVVEQQSCGSDLYRLRLRATDGDFGCEPGQFVMLDLPEPNFRFRRPFSVLATPARDTLDLYYKVVGYGTRQMAGFALGQKLCCLGPLGNAFPMPASAGKALYIGGGIGIAPLLFLRQKAEVQALPTSNSPQNSHCFYGVRRQAEIGLEKDLKHLFPHESLHIATDDGSQGFHGNVVQALASVPTLVSQAEYAYVCGPARMMEAVCQHLKATNPAIRIYVSLESHMPCGTGACTGCVVPRPASALPAKVCFEGPVFDSETILWHFADEAPCFPTTTFPGNEGTNACP